MNSPGKRENDSFSNDEILKRQDVINLDAGSISSAKGSGYNRMSINSVNGSSIQFDKDGTTQINTRDSISHTLGHSTNAVNGSQITNIDEHHEEVIGGDHIVTIGDAAKWQPLAEKILKAHESIHKIKQQFDIQRTTAVNPIDQATGQVKAGVHAPCPVCAIKSPVLKTKSFTRKLFGRLFTSGPIQEMVAAEQYIPSPGIPSPYCTNCHGTNISKSSQDGVFSPNPAKLLLPVLNAEKQAEIYSYEKELGTNACPSGGSEIKTISKNKVETVGLAFNSMTSYRKDPVGKLVPKGLTIRGDGSGITPDYGTSPLLEPVDVTRQPGGSYDLTVCDGMRITTGSNGVDLKTTGSVNMFGPMMDFSGEQLSLNGKSEIGLKAGRIDLSGEIITLSPKKRSGLINQAVDAVLASTPPQVFVDGNLSVGSNTVMRGGLHVEGELSVQHITAPMELHITEGDFTYGVNLPGVPSVELPLATIADGVSPTYASMIPGLVIGEIKITADDINSILSGKMTSIPVRSVISPNCSLVAKHHHEFKSLPVKLFEPNSPMIVNGIPSIADPNTATRAMAAAMCNTELPAPALPIINADSSESTVDKFGGSILGGPLVIAKNKILSVSKAAMTKLGALGKTVSGIKSVVDDITAFLPKGEGAGTSNYSSEYIASQTAEIDQHLETTYTDLKEKLSNSSQSDNC